MKIQMILLGYLKRKIIQFKWHLIELRWQFIKMNYGNDILSNKDFSIGIVTYVDRYHSFFKPLIKRLVYLFPDTQIIVCINGFYDIHVQKRYLLDINQFLSKFKNIRIVDYSEPQSLSKLWNNILLNSMSDKALILNDDINLSFEFRNELQSKKLMLKEFSLINRSWSHFLISKEIIRKIGWFDERFPGVGNEDEDYECRMRIDNLAIYNTNIGSVKNIIFKTKIFSYGPNVAVVNKKYVKDNQLFFYQKWHVSKQEKEGYIYVDILGCYVRIKFGMETPTFYNLDELSS